MLEQKIKKTARDIAGDIIRLRRILHSRPELSFQEFETAAFIKAELDKMDIPWKAMAGTGVLATIKGVQPSEKTIALRADIDALPITELNKVEYRSLADGVMHACGHDAHMASLLGTARILAELKEHFGGTVKLLFQPGEEKLPGGATMMIRDGALRDPAPIAIIGQHVKPSIRSGKIGIRKGAMMASMDEIIVRVKGRGGHGASPHENIDPVAIACQMVVGLQQVVSRFSNPAIPSVLSFGKFIANGSINVIPDEAYLEGTFRTIDEDWRTKAHEQMVRAAQGIAEAFGATCEFTINRGYPALVNSEKFTTDIEKYAIEYLGADNIEYPGLWMAAEDFAYYGQELDACFYLLGTDTPAGDKSHPLHNPRFDIDETSLTLSTGLMAWFAIRSLGYGQPSADQ
jgi:amidohydrolase